MYKKEKKSDYLSEKLIISKENNINQFKFILFSFYYISCIIIFILYTCIVSYIPPHYFQERKKMNSITDYF